MKRIFLILILGSLAAGCGSEKAAGPEPLRVSWDLVRFQESSESGSGFAQDLTVRPNGALVLVGGRGEVSTRGLLAGEKLETLARLIDDLPPHPYAPSAPCPMDSFVVSVSRDGGVLRWISGSCDPDAPAALSGLYDLFHALALEARERGDRSEPRVLLEGETGPPDLVGERLIRDRDGLIALLSELNPGSPVALPAVDFNRELVVAEFVGERPSGGYVVGVDGIERTESGWLKILFHEVEPGPSCPVAAGVTRPYVLVAIDRQGDLLFETSVTTTSCNGLNADGSSRQGARPPKKGEES